MRSVGVAALEEDGGVVGDGVLPRVVRAEVRVDSRVLPIGVFASVAQTARLGDTSRLCTKEVVAERVLAPPRHEDRLCHDCRGVDVVLPLVLLAREDNLADELLLGVETVFGPRQVPSEAALTAVAGSLAPLHATESLLVRLLLLLD